MEFLLVWDWIDEHHIFIKQHVDFFATKEQLFEAKKAAEANYSLAIARGRLILSPAVGYSWADMQRLF